MCPLSIDMLKIISSIVTDWGWTPWMFLHLMVSGACSLVTVRQPSVLTTALGHNVTMPCQLELFDEEMVDKTILYWSYLGAGADDVKLWPPIEKYKERVDLLNKTMLSSNKSILLKSVQWADSGQYLCKVSIVTTKENKRFRRAGNKTLLMVYDTMSFNLTSYNDSLLRCEVNVTQEPGFVLSVSYHGSQTVDSAPGDYGAALPYVTLSETISLRGGGKYECQLRLNEDLITKRIFHYHPPVAGEGGAAGENISSVSELGVVVFSEPWILYIPLLLVPVTTLLGLLIALLMCRSGV